jgi:hypothetical protein
MSAYTGTRRSEDVISAVDERSSLQWARRKIELNRIVLAQDFGGGGELNRIGPPGVASEPLSDVYAPTGFNEVFPALFRPATPTPHKIFLLLNHQKTSGTLWPSLLRDSNKTHSPPQFHLGPRNSRTL